MRRLLFAAACLILLPASLLAQEAGPEELDFGPSLSLDLGTPGLARLGAWTGVGDRLTLGLEVETDYLSWTRYPDGDPARARSGTEWRFAAGPAARVRLVSTGSVSLSLYGSATWGQHRFAVSFPEGLPWEGAYDAPSEWGIRPGVGLDWSVSDRWTVGVLYSVQRLSGSSGVDGLPASTQSPRLGFSIRFGF